MRAAPTTLALLLLATLSSGCLGGFGDVRGGMGGGPSVSGSREVPLEVVGARAVPGRCFDGATAFGEVCHLLQVQVDNRDGLNPLDVGALTWTADDAEGKGHRFADTDADEVAGGAVATVEVGFTVEDGNADLVRVRYSSFQGRGAADVPGY